MVAERAREGLREAGEAEGLRMVTEL